MPYKLKTNTMKKVLLAVAVVAFFASCKKDYTCECTVDLLGVKTTSSTTLNATKSDAKEACEAGNQTGVTCEIK